ncbi:MAG TPA: NADH-quinone oxidoreductase subunit C [Gammaproteobacteria bacterium]|nr:NADH-quinone oxidoreductase subunit C [Gammaproteobacteria bacterium]
MTDAIHHFANDLQSRLGPRLAACIVDVGEVTLEVPVTELLEVMRSLRDDWGFEQLIDVCGVDYSQYGLTEWETSDASREGFSRGVEVGTAGYLDAVHDELSTARPAAARRFAAVYHLLSVQHNRRLRVRAYAPDDELPVIPSVIEIWNGADWYEREAFDLFGILFEGHPDLRRILTDYGFVGHPFRKDFPLSGNVEVRYDPEKQRVVYQPVSIEPRVLVPKVIRDDVTRRNAGQPAVQDAEDA